MNRVFDRVHGRGLGTRGTGLWGVPLALLIAAVGCGGGGDGQFGAGGDDTSGGTGGDDLGFGGNASTTGSGSGSGGAPPDPDSGSSSSGAGGNSGSGSGGNGGGSTVPDVPWSDRFGDNLEQEGYDVAYDPQGNIVITGRFKGVIDFGNGPLGSAGDFDVFVAKFDPDGNPLWSKRFGTLAYDAGRTIATDSQGNIYVGGEFTGANLLFGGSPLNSAGGTDIFLVKLDPQGNHLWSKRFGDKYHQNVYGVAVDANGNAIITGRMYGTVNFGGVNIVSAGSGDVFVAKFDTTGNHQWSKRFGDGYYQVAYDVTVDGAGNIFITGEHFAKIDFGGGPLPSAGTERSNVFVAKLDPNGVYKWAYGYGNSSTQLGMALAVHPSGDVIVAGQFGGTINLGGVTLTSKGGYDIFLARLAGANGTHVWSTRYGEGYDQRAFGVGVAQDGTIWMNGDFQYKVDFGSGTQLVTKGGYDLFLARFDDQGNYIAASSYGDANNYQTGRNSSTTSAHVDGRGGIAVNAQGSAAVVGSFAGTIDYGQGPLNSAGGYDVFLAQVLP